MRCVWLHLEIVWRHRRVRPQYAPGPPRLGGHAHSRPCPRSSRAQRRRRRLHHPHPHHGRPFAIDVVAAAVRVRRCVAALIVASQVRTTLPVCVCAHLTRRACSLCSPSARSHRVASRRLASSPVEPRHFMSCRIIIIIIVSYHHRTTRPLRANLSPRLLLSSPLVRRTLTLAQRPHNANDACASAPRTW